MYPKNKILLKLMRYTYLPIQIFLIIYNISDNSQTYGYIDKNTFNLLLVHSMYMFPKNTILPLVLHSKRSKNSRYCYT